MEEHRRPSKASSFARGWWVPFELPPILLPHGLRGPSPLDLKFLMVLPPPDLTRHPSSIVILGAILGTYLGDHMRRSKRHNVVECWSFGLEPDRDASNKDRSSQMHRPSANPFGSWSRSAQVPNSH